MEYKKAYEIAEAVLELLRPHCERCEIAGSLRRGKAEVKDIEIVAIPKPYEIGLLESGLAEVVNCWPKIKGPLKYGVCKNTQRLLPENIVLDIWFADRKNWGLIYALRTGNVDFNKMVLIPSLKRKGYISQDGYLRKGNEIVDVPEEIDLFIMMEMRFRRPEQRKVG